jgi:hypothetical protein
MLLFTALVSHCRTQDSFPTEIRIYLVNLVGWQNTLKEESHQSPEEGQLSPHFPRHDRLSAQQA